MTWYWGSCRPHEVSGGMGSVPVAGQDAAQELDGVEGQPFLFAAVLVVLDGEGDLASLEVDDAVVGDGHAVGVAAQVAEDLLGSAEGRLGVDDPVLAVEAVAEAPPPAIVGQIPGAAVEAQVARGACLFERGEELAAVAGTRGWEIERWTTPVDPGYTVTGTSFPLR